MRKLQKMQCFGDFVANCVKRGFCCERLDIQLYNAYPSLTLRSAFGMPSLTLRYGFEMLFGAIEV